MILNTLDNLGKFQAKGDEGYFIGYSMSSKAFRVFNKRTRRVEENLHVEFLENKAIEEGVCPNWLSDIDSLTKSMNYVPVDARTDSANLSGTKDAASQEVKKDVSFLRYIALPNWVHDALLESSSSKPQDDSSIDVPESSGNSNPTATSTNPPADQLETLIVETPILTVSSPVPTACLNDSPEPSSDTRDTISKRVANQEETPSLDNILTLTNQFEDILGVTTNSVDSDGVEADVSNMETTITASPTPTLRIHKDHPKKPKKIFDALQDPSWVEAMQKELLQLKIQNVWTLVDCPKRVRPIGTKWVLKNKKDERGIVIRNKARLVAQGHTQEEGIAYDEVFAPVARIEAIRLFLAYASFMGFTVYQMDVKSAFLYGTIDEEVSLNTPMDKENPWGKDGTRKDVDLHLYRSMIGSLMYLTASRIDIMFAVYAYSNYKGATQDCKSITGGCQFLGRRLISWQCKKHTIVATSTTEAEYVAAASCCGQVLWIQNQLLDYGDCFEKKLISVDHIHTDENIADLLTKPFDAGRFQYLVISIGMCKLFPLLGKLSTVSVFLGFGLTFTVDFVEASPLMYALTFKPTIYVAHIRQFWSTARIETTKEGTKILANVDGIHITITESSLRRNLKLQDEEGISSLPDTKLFENLTLMGYNISPNQKFTFQKGQFSHQWKYLIHTIMQCLSPNSTGFNKFNSNIATALVCLATNKTYNFSKIIFDGLVKNVNNKVSKFLMYLRFLTMFLRMSQFGQITHTHTYVVPFHTRKLFTTLRVNSPSFSGRIVPPFDTMLVPQGEGSGTPTKPHHTLSLEAQQTSHTTPSSPPLPPITTASIPTVTQSETTPLRQYTRRARANIAKTSTLPHDSVARVTSPATDEGSMQLKLDELTGLCTSLQRKHSEMVAKFEVQELEINRLKARVKLLEDREGVAAKRSGDNAPIKGRNLDKGEVVAKRVIDDTEEMETVLTSIETATVLASRAADIPTGSGSIPTAGSSAAEVPTGSDVVPTASTVFATATVVTPYRRRKGKEITVESETPKKKKVAKDTEVARIHAEEKLQMMINSLDRSNETVLKYLQEYEQKPWSKKQKRDYYMAVIKSNLGWKVKDFKGMTFEELEAKFTAVWKQVEDFIPMGSKEEAERFKRKGIRFEQESVKNLKTSEEVPEEVKTPNEVPEEKVKEMMRLVPIEEVYVEALQVKHPIIDWNVHTEGQRSYWKIIRLGGSSASYQFFVDLLKHMDREDLNQLWALVKESLTNRPPTSNKEMELWVELKRLYEPNDEDQLWTHT
uniref:Putative ribonuclease H-like domain-containing protein n=1 Tax=Tanacetum cinerariifolium TaxID=118510 RepID=A0A699HGR3_TANCI|nr:putative ribonuclease H-like domain-containing protein [Tanacetum cinerariifolium]